MCELYYLSLSIPLIGLYLNSLTYFYPTKNINEIDILNRKIISINICGWNLLHTLLFYYICKAKNVKIIVTNSLYPIPSATTQTWMDNHTCVFFVGDIKAAHVKEKKIVEL